MRCPLLARLERLEAILAVQQVGKICYGWLTPLPDDYVGERHVVTVSREPSGSPRFEWCQCEERAGPIPPYAVHIVPNDMTSFGRRLQRSNHVSQTVTLNLIPSLGACTRSCFVPRYRSVVWTLAWPSS